jgi:gliding motility-associated-like protein
MKLFNFTASNSVGKLTFCLSLFIISLIPIQALAQLDVEHYVPPLFGREDKGTHFIVLSTPSTTPFVVTITDGSGNVIATPSISSAASFSYYLGAGDATEFLVTEAELNTIMTNHGLILTATEPFYVNIRVFADPQGGSLTSKGSKAAFGQDFWTGHMFGHDFDDFRKSHGFGIMATENNTTINISNISPGVIFRGTTPVGVPLTSPNVTVVLNAGETYVMSAFMDEPGQTNNMNGVNGTHITSDKDIVVNCTSWLAGNGINSGSNAAGRDLGIDQIVPVESVGDEYVLIKGEGLDNEKTVIVATAANTDIFIDGNPVAIANLANPGDYYVLDGTLFSGNDNLYLTSSSPVYLYQMTNGGDPVTYDNERQNGLMFLPPVGCSGGKNVFLPNVDSIGTAFINIIADAGANVYVNSILQGAGDPIIGTANYVTYKLTSGYTGDVVITSDKLIRVALINLSGNIGAAAYFSGFTKDFNVQTNTVNGDNIALEGCISASFTFGIDAPSSLPTVVTYQIWGTATNGVDYSFIDTTVTIPAGQTQATIIINAIQDGIPEGQESIFIVYQPDLCSPLDTAFLYIDDAQPIQFTLNETDLTCFENSTGQIQVNASGGFPPYTYEVTGPGGQTNDTINPITGLAAGTYTVQVYDIYGCKAQALVIGGVFDADTLFLPDGNGVTYTSQIPISGFGAGATIDSLSQILQICATMEHSYLGDLEIKVLSPSGQSIVLKEQNGGGSCDLGEPIATGPVDGAAGSLLTDPGIGYEYCWNSTPTYITMVGESNNFTRNYTDGMGNNYTDTYLPQGSYQPFDPLANLLGSLMDGNWTMEITDQFSLDNGYIFEWNVSLVGSAPDTTVIINEPDSIQMNGFITQAQCGGNDGAINLTVNGDFPPFTFLWSNGATTEDISGLSAGNYTVIVTDTTGCSDSIAFNLNNISSMNISYTVTDVNCAGGNNGAIDVTTSGGTPPYTFSWDNGATTEDISSLTAGSYIITITDATGCQFSDNIIIGTLPPIVVTLNNSGNEFCGQVNGSIDINVTGGSGSYGFAWDNGASTEDLTNIAGGVYEVTITDANGCQTIQSFNILNDVSNCSAYCFLTVQSTVTDENCGDGTGAIDISITQATQPYIVSWNTGDTIEDISGLNAGTYTITVTDANQCVEIVNINIGNNTGNLAISSTQTSNENCGNADGSIDITVAGGTLPYTFSWDNGATTEDISNLSAGIYTVTITDGNGCTFSNGYTILNNTGNLAESAVVYNESCGNGAGAIDLTVTGNAGTLSYLWSNGATTQDLTGLSAGLYSCTITDANGCVLVSSSYNLINESSTLLLTNTVIDNEDCNNGLGSIDITIQGGTPPITYLWNTGATTEDISGLSAGTYSCTITDANGCSVSTGILNLFNAPGTLNISTDFVTDEICGNGAGAIFVSTSGGTTPISYSWSNGSTSEDISSLVAGTYTLTATDSNGCVYNHNETVVNTSGTLQIDNAIVVDENCNDGAGSIDIFISGGATPYTFSWSNGASTEDISSLSAGTYIVTVTDANGCQADQSYTINNITGTLAVSVQGTAENCSNGLGAIDLTVTGGTGPYTYLWNTGPTTEDLTGISGGTYSCTITDQGTGCIVLTGNIIIGNNPGTLIVTNVTTDESCGDASGSVTLSTSGGANPLTFSWNPSPSITNIASGLSAGFHIYTVTDANGCTITDSAEIFNNTGTLSLDSINVTDELCGDGAGGINITVSGGTAPVTFLWNTGPTTEDISGLSTGTYSCTITDAAGCSLNTGNINVSNNSGTLAISNILINDESCGNSLGAINITIIGGNTPYTFLWNTGATTEDLLTGLSAGNYTCDVTDAAGCTIQVQATVQNTQGSLYTISNIVTDESCSTGNGAINLNPLGGTTPYTFVWSNGATTEDISSLSAGNYTVTITDVGGCSLIENFTVTNNGANILISGVTIDDEMCGNSAGGVDITIQGGTSPFTYNWSNGSSLQDLVGVVAGTYTVTATDANGCSTNGNFTVNENTGSLAIDTFTITDEICGDGTGAIDVAIASSTNPCCSYTLNMYDGNNNGWGGNPVPEVQIYINSASIGTYTIPPGAGNSFQTENIPICDGDTIAVEYLPGAFNNSNSYDIVDAAGSTIFADGPNPTGPGIAFSTVASCPSTTTAVTYSWSNGATTEDISGVNAGTYTVTITNLNGCSVDSTGTIQNNTGGFTASLTGTTDENCGDTTGTVDITVAGGSLPYTFVWDNGASSEDLTNLSAGTYNVVVTDASGCSTNLSATINNITGTLIVSNAVTNDENCNDATGYVDLTINGTNTPFTYLWSNGATTQDISGLSAGTYTVTITDASGCMIVENYAINNNSAGLNIGITMNDENCSNSDGNITATASGGVAPYVITWTGGLPTNCCTYTLNMQDQGNSWNGASIDVLVNGLTIGNYTVAGGGSNTETFNVCTGDAIELLWNAGGFDNEVSFDLLDGSSTIVYNHPAGTGPTPGSIFTGTASCPAGPVNPSSLNNIPAGTYTVTVTDVNGCSISDTIIINNNFTFSTSGNVNDENCIAMDGAIDLTTVGGTTPFTFSWSNGATTEDISNVAAGTYIVTSTDATGCSIVDTFTVNNIVAFTTSGIVTDNNCGLGNGTVDLTVAGGTAPFTHIWSNGTSNEDVSNLIAGTYTVTSTDASGCSVIDTFVINNSATFTSAGIITNDICGSGIGAIDLTLTGATAPITFNWSNSVTTEDLSGIGSGTYTVISTDATGCSVADTFIVTNTTIFSYSAMITNDSCGLNNGVIDLTITGGTAPFTFSWNNGATTEDISNLSSGTYSVTMVDAGGCSDVAVFVVNSSSTIISSGTIINDTCGLGNGSIDLSINGGGTPCCTYTIDMLDTFGDGWNGASLDVNINGSLFNNITVPVGGSAATEIIPICNGDLLELVYNPGTFDGENSYTLYNSSGTSIFSESAPPNSGSAYSATANCNASAPIVTYNWSNGETTEDISSLMAGTYTVTITDTATGCMKVDSFIVNNITTFTAFGVTTDDTCNLSLGAIDITIAGGISPFTFAWSNGAITEDITGLNSGIYSVTITDASGCSEIQSFTINNIATFNYTAIAYNDSCAMGLGSIDLIPTGGTTPFTFAWSNGASTEDLSGLNAGTYSVIITDASGCSAVDSFTINNISLYTYSGTVTGDSCNLNNGAIDLTLIGGSIPFTFAWSNGATTEDVSGLSAGNYSVTITDASGCAKVAAFNVSNTASFTSTGVISDDNCNTSIGAIDLDVTGGISCCTYTLDMQDQGNSWNGASIDVLIDGINIGNFTVPGGGANIETFSVCDGESIELLWNPGGFDNEVSFDLLDASSNLVFSQGANPTPGSIFTGTGSCPASTPTVNYAWSNGATTQDISGLNSGIYWVTITDPATGCFIIDTFIVDNSATFTSMGTVINDTCSGGIGSIDLTTTGGTNPFTFVWSNGATTEDISGLISGTYSVTITDGSGCSAIDSFVINNITTLNYTSITSDDNCNTGIGAVDLTIISGTTPITYAWSNGATTEDVSGLNSGIYSVTITDASGCSAIDSFIINNTTTFSYTSIITNDSCNAGIGAVDLSITGGAAPFTFAWSNGAITEDISGLISGTYLVNITDASGCTAIDSFTVTSINLDDATFSYSPSSFCQSDPNPTPIVTGTIGGTFSSAVGLTISSNTGFIDLGNSTPGTYGVLYTTSGTCPDTLTVFVTIIDCTIPITSFSSSDSTLCEGDCINFTDLSTNTPTGWTWYFSGSSQPIVTGTATPTNICYPAAGNYPVKLVVSNSSGVDSLEIVGFISVIAAPTITASSDTTVCSVTSVTISANGGTTYSWDNGLGFGQSQTVSPSITSTYTVTGTDLNGCSSTDSVILSVDSLPIVVASDDTLICVGSTVIINVTGALTYSWNNGMGTGNIISVSPNTTTTYTVIGTNVNGCSNVDDVTIFIDDNNCLDIPTAFSPNADGQNDLWNIRGIEAYPDIIVKVFNRWGSELFSSDRGYTDPWDGTYNGTDVPPATYYFIVDFGNGEDPRSGTINIIR